jgi:hypothetical protein
MKQLTEWVLVTIALFLGAAISGIILSNFHWQFVIGASVGVGLSMLLGSESKEKK